jgi:chemotaxis family two-component system sensor kinase Cph1
VRDNGVGFDKKHAPKLFENFQRFHGDEYEGHGIGLAMVRRIIEAHGSEVKVQSALGKGSCFSFKLPALQDPLTET